MNSSIAALKEAEDLDNLDYGELGAKDFLRGAST